MTFVNASDLSKVIMTTTTRKTIRKRCDSYYVTTNDALEREVESRRIKKMIESRIARGRGRGTKVMGESDVKI